MLVQVHSSEIGDTIVNLANAAFIGRIEGSRSIHFVGSFSPIVTNNPAEIALIDRWIKLNKLTARTASVSKRRKGIRRGRH